MIRGVPQAVLREQATAPQLAEVPVVGGGQESVDGRHSPHVMSLPRVVGTGAGCGVNREVVVIPTRFPPSAACDVGRINGCTMNRSRGRLIKVTATGSLLSWEGAAVRSRPV